MRLYRVLTGCLLGVSAFSQTSVEMPKVSPLEFKGDVRLMSTWPMPVTPLRANKPERDGPAVEKLVDPRFAAGPSSIALPAITAPAPSPSANFAGLSLGDAVTGGQAGAGYPPDTVGDVGPKHFILGVNDAYAIYDKATGTRLAAFTENALWAGVGSTHCNGNAFGDPVVLYDVFADRWILTHFAFTLTGTTTNPNVYQCIAASKTNDPVNGGWYLYALRMDPGTTGTPPAGALADYPKFGIWTDCLYMGANVFNAAGTAYLSPLYASFSRNDLYSGAPLTWSMIYPNTNTVFSNFPAHASAKSPGARPPAGRPAIFVGESSSVFGWESRTFTPGTNCGAGGVLSVTTTATHPSYSLLGTRVPQPGTTQTLDTLTDRLMNKPFYRKVGNAESIWVTNSIRSSAGQVYRVHWSQLDVTGGTLPTTLAQDAFHGDTVSSGLHRWMGSIAADNQGNMAVGYSTANGTAPNYPSLRYAGRLAADPVNTLPQTETTLIAGTGSQTGIERWGDYAAMSIDPVDDCTFWFTSEYYITNGNNWNTRIGSFKYPGCTAPTSGANLTITKTHSGNFTLSQSGAQYTITVSNVGDAPSYGMVTVTDTVPTGLTATNISGTGWTCTQPAGPCQRTDALNNGASYPALTLTVNVAANAPSSVTNTAEVSGGSDMVYTNNIASDLTTVVPQLSAPTVSSFQLLFGTQTYELIGSSRTRLPWTTITGIRVKFSTVITAANAASLSGLSATGFSGLNTDTLTWTFTNPLPLGTFAASLLGTGGNAISGPGGALTTYNQSFKVLPGDFNDDGQVNAVDMTAVNNARAAAYNVLADINGNGTVDVTDVNLVRSRIGTTLP